MTKKSVQLPHSKENTHKADYKHRKSDQRPQEQLSSGKQTPPIKAEILQNKKFGHAKRYIKRYYIIIIAGTITLK